MLDLKVRRIGNSLGVVLPKEALALLRVDDGDKIHLTQDADGVLRLMIPNLKSKWNRHSKA